jgi:hypothetical protein
MESNEVKEKGKTNKQEEKNQIKQTTKNVSKI